MSKHIEPKYPIGSSVTYSKGAGNKQFIVAEFVPPKPGIRVMPAYRIYPADDFNRYYSVTESELSPWVDEEPNGYFDDVDGVWVEVHKPTQDNQTYTNEQGGKQSFVSVRFDCIPPVVLRLLAQCLGFGARKYGKENWQQIEQWDHLNHAMNHINEWNRGDRSEPHLVNAMARLTFALWQAVDNKTQPDTYIHPDEVK